MPAGGVVVADVFLAFHPCPRGYTPAFATGPFDALDASQPSRVRDAYELSLVLRTESDPTLPVASDPWSTIAGGTLQARLTSARNLALTNWYQVAQPAPENPPTVDANALLLARLRLPAAPNADAAQAPTPDWSPDAWTNPETNLDNGVRHVLLPPAAIRHLLT